MVIFFFVQTLSKDVTRLQNELDSKTKELDNETILRIDLENKLQSMKESINFKEQVNQRVNLEWNRFIKMTKMIIATYRHCLPYTILCLHIERIFIRDTRRICLDNEIVVPLYVYTFSISGRLDGLFGFFFLDV